MCHHFWITFNILVMDFLLLDLIYYFLNADRLLCGKWVVGRQCGCREVNWDAHTDVQERCMG